MRCTSKSLLVTIAACVASLTISLSAHDLFFRARQYVIAPGSDAFVEVYTGTFSVSENAVKRDLPVALEVVMPAGGADFPRARWDDSIEPKSVVRVLS